MRGLKRTNEGQRLDDLSAFHMTGVRAIRTFKSSQEHYNHLNHVFCKAFFFLAFMMSQYLTYVQYYDDYSHNPNVWQS